MARFCLGQLLAFVFACCVYLAALRNVVPLDQMNGPSGSLWPIIFTQIGAWFILSAFYWHWRLTLTGIVHLAMMAFVMNFIYLGSGESTPISFKGMGTTFAVVLGCTLGTLISFPIAVVTISFRAIRRRPSRRDIHLPRWARGR